LGETIDIHSGGADLCFPHHECEIAQVEPVTNEQPFVRYWMHTAMVYHDGDKMSKSLGNLVWVRELLKTYSPDALRLYMGKHHYREEWRYNEAELKVAEKEAKLIRKALRVSSGQVNSLSASSAWDNFAEAMENDLDTPTAVTVQVDLAWEVLRSANQRMQVDDAQGTLREMSDIFGLRLGAAPEARVAEGWGEHLKKFE
jgi:L-cysteine:1D-myo-inositol 2-amino-2-deoxy-alpha-D-glucopyranoside ligase